MKTGLSFGGLVLLWVLILAMGAGCDETNTITAPVPFVPIIETLELTPAVDSGSPVPLQADGELLSILYTCVFGGSGDIYRQILVDTSADGYYDSFELAEFYPNENDSSDHFTVPAHEQFSFIGAYEIESSGVNGDTVITNYPGNTYISGPRHLYYDSGTDRVYYSMGYGKVSQISSTVSPRDAFLGHTGEIINSYDPPLEEIFSDGARAPIWEYWYTKVPGEGNDFLFSGGYYASVSPLIQGKRWLAYADTLLESYDRDGYDQYNSEQAGEDPEGAIETYDGLPDDGAPGYFDVDDDGDGLFDFEDIEVVAMMASVGDTALVPPADLLDWEDWWAEQWSLGWSSQNYDPANDDDEDGLMDEDPEDFIDNDGDGLVNEDPIEPQIDNDGDGQINEDPPNGEDDDGDGLIDEDGPEPQIDNDGDGLINEDGPDYIDNDGDGEIDEDPLGDVTDINYGVPGYLDYDDDEDGFADLEDPQVRHSVLRAAMKDDYLPDRDDDEDGISDEDGDLYRNGLWVVELGEGGMPDPSAIPISLSNDGGRQPFFSPDGSDLLYVKAGDIYRMFLAYTPETVTVTGTENLSNSASLEGYPSYSEAGDRIVYCSSFYGTSDIWVMEADGSTKRVTNLPGQELYPRFTPAGNQILFEAWLHPSGVRRVMITTGELP